MPFIAWLNNKVVGLATLVQVELIICNKAICVSVLVHVHILSIHLKNLTCFHLSIAFMAVWCCLHYVQFLQNFLNFSEINLPSASDIIILGCLHSEKRLHMLVSRCPVIDLPTIWLLAISYNSLQCKCIFLYKGDISGLTVSHGIPWISWWSWCSPLVSSAEIQDMFNSF